MFCGYQLHAFVESRIYTYDVHRLLMADYYGTVFSFVMRKGMVSGFDCWGIDRVGEGQHLEATRGESFLSITQNQNAFV